jgi:hypothetical protein
MIKHIFQRSDGTFQEITFVVPPESDPIPKPEKTLRFNGDESEVPSALLDEILADTNAGANYETFIDECYSIPNFASEVATKPGWLVVQERLKKDDYTNALAVFEAMGVSPVVTNAMLPLAMANDLPQPVIDALSSSS